MRAMFARDVAIAVRRPAFAAVVSAHVALLAGFVLVWGDMRVPVLSGDTVYEQQRTIEWALLALLLPWSAARSIATEGRDDFVRLSVLTGVQPGRLLLGKLSGSFAALALLVLSALPVAVLAQQMSAVPLSRVMADLVPSLGFAALVCLVTFWWMAVVRDRLAAWLAAAGSTVVILTAAHSALRTDAALTAGLVAFSIAGAAALAAHAQASWRYLPERET